MRHSNIVKLDSKGRVLIPIHLRKTLEADEGTEIILMSNDESREVKMVPLVKDRSAEMRFLVADMPDSFAMIANILATHKLNIVMSQSRTLVRGKVAEWSVIVDISGSENNGGMERLRSELSSSKFIKSFDIIRK
jgi:bifunctional DNA-binding transcriptional regulator/antitoxin component of YhaV-PrlF toxin-antitoxin module